MRITVVEPDGAGGLIHYAWQLSAALQAAGPEVTLITGRDYELADLEAPFRVDARMRLWPAAAPGTKSLPGLVHRVRRMARGIRYAIEWHRLTCHLLRERPDLVLFSVIRFPFLVVFLRRLSRAGLTLAQVCHEFEARESRSSWAGGLRRRLLDGAYRSFRVIFFHGEVHRQRFRDLFDAPGMLEVIPHGNQSLLAGVADTGGDLRERYRIGPDRPVAVFFGGLRPSKGVADLLDSFADVQTQVPEAALVIAGPPVAGTDLPALEDRIARLHLDNAVTIDARYLPIGEIGPLIRTADVVVLPYRSGTASGALQAAYAFGRPVVTTDVGSLAEAVDPGSTGLVVPPEDREALTAALVKMLGDRHLAAGMGTAAAAAARERFAWGPIAERVIETCRRVT